ncbi:MAG: hypothetical protein GC155_09045 [Alphaproteobacteria bacterium]|nr:hypothetical protein [Alphaproteobacteria bacterium]
MPHRSIGTRAFVCALELAGAAGFLMLAAPAAAACQLRQLAEIPVEIVGNRPVISGQINEHDATFLVDTGASSSTIWYQSTKKLGLRPQFSSGTSFAGVGGNSEAGYVALDTLMFASLTIRKVHMFVSGQFSAGDAATDAVLGAEFLGLTTVEFDLAHRVIRLLDDNDCKGDEVVYWHGAYAVEKLTHPKDPNGKFQVEVKLNGNRARAQLDTGASTSVLSAEGAAIAGVKPVAGKDGDDFSGIGHKAVAASTVKLDTFAFDQEVIQNPKISTADLFGANQQVSLGSRIPQYNQDFPAILLGADFFLSHRVLVSQAQGRVYISYVGGPVFQTSVPSATVAAPGK